MFFSKIISFYLNKPTSTSQKKNNRFGETPLDKKTAFEKQNPFAERNNFVWKKQLWKKEPVQKKKTYPFSFFFEKKTFDKKLNRTLEKNIENENKPR